MPFAVLIAFSFNESKSRTVITCLTLNGTRTCSTTTWGEGQGVSLGVAFAAACIATVVGTLASIRISIKNKRARARHGRQLWPVVNPEIITGVSLMLLFVVFNRQVSAALSWLLQREVELQGFGLGTLLIAHITFCLPYVIFNVSPKLRQLDPAVYDAALDLGCNPRQAFFKVVLPHYAATCRRSHQPHLIHDDSSFPISPRHMQTLPISFTDDKKRSARYQRAFRHHVRGI